MRLIDADELRYSHCVECALYPDKCLGKDCDWGSIYHIDHAPTVEAIPVEWIRKYIKEYPYMTASSMLHYWSLDQALERKAIERKKGKKND